jgi:hypothetical protein
MTGWNLGGRVRKLRHAWLALTLLTFAIECPSAYGNDAPNFVFVDGAAVTLSPDGSNGFKFDILLKNSGGKEGEASLNILSGTDKGCNQAKTVVNPKAMIRLAPNAVAIAQIEIANVKLPATCYIELMTEGAAGNASLKQLKLTQQYVTATVLMPLSMCFGISVLVAVLAWGAAARCVGRISPNFRLGSPAWDFAKSWTSTTTLVTAIISTALTLSALPELTQYASKSGYSALVLLISLAVIIAPFVFIALRTGAIIKDAASGNYAVIYQGCLLPFLLSCAITLFAGLSQLVVLFFLLDEVFKEDRFWSFGSGLKYVLGLALCWYAGYSIFLTIKLQAAADQEAAAKTFQGAKGPLLDWLVL